jgi:hypothetical protein
MSDLVDVAKVRVNSERGGGYGDSVLGLSSSSDMVICSTNGSTK